MKRWVYAQASAKSIKTYDNVFHTSIMTPVVIFTGVQNSSGLGDFRSHATTRMNRVHSSMNSLVLRALYRTRLKIT